MQDVLNRQLLAAAIALVIASDVPAAPPRPRQSSSPEEELQAARLVEATIFAQNPTGEARERMRTIYAHLEAQHPKDVPIKNAFAEFLWNAEEHVEAVKRWHAAERLDPQNAVVLDHLGDAYLTAGDVQRSFDYFTRASRVVPSNPLYHLNVANVAFMFRHDLPLNEDAALELARREFCEASRLAPASAEYARAYAEIFYNLPHPDWQAALAAWERFRELTTNKDFALVNLARVHMKLGQKAAARACLSSIQGTDFERVKAKLGERLNAD
jgi:tetratricopeptide (TPR) repeat protein